MLKAKFKIQQRGLLAHVDFHMQKHISNELKVLNMLMQFSKLKRFYYIESLANRIADGKAKKMSTATFAALREILSCCANK